MIDYTLKFPDEATANQVLGPFMATHNIDVIGVISKPTDKMIKTSEGLVPVMAELPGWHVNVRGSESEALAEYSTEVSTPARVWA